MRIATFHASSVFMKAASTNWSLYRLRHSHFSLVPTILHARLWQSNNIFDNMPALMPPKPTKVADELAVYVLSAAEAVQDPIQWWHEHHHY